MAGGGDKSVAVGHAAAVLAGLAASAVATGDVVAGA